MKISPCLGYAETQHLSISFYIADAMVKAANVELLGLEPNGTEGICIRLGAQDPASLQAALAEAETLAKELGSTAACAVLARPDQAMHHLNDGPMTIHGIYGGREEFKPTDYPQQNKGTDMNKNSALGILETQGLTASLAAADVMFKVANVQLVGKEKIGAAYVTIMVRGDVAAVNAAIEAGMKEAEGYGKVIAAKVIANPHQDMTALLPA